MVLPGLWVVGPDPKVDHKFGVALLRDARLGVTNTAELSEARRHLGRDFGDGGAPWPESYPHPVAGLPDRFTSDFWQFGTYDFASARLREAMAQPPEVVEFVPFELTLAGPAARAQDYRWMRVVARQEALDLDRCECRIEVRPHHVTGRPIRSLGNITYLALRTDLVPGTDIFRLDECPTYVYVTDALAERVLRAGCTGMEFAHPENRSLTMGIRRHRTVAGMAERRFGF